VTLKTGAENLAFHHRSKLYFNIYWNI